MDDIIEKLAAIEHKQWTHWMRSVVTSEAISMKRKERWFAGDKPYHELTEEQKEQDRIWARKVLELFKEEYDWKEEFGNNLKREQLIDYWERAKDLVTNCTKPRIIPGAEHWGETITLPQSFIKELHEKLGEALGMKTRVVKPRNPIANSVRKIRPQKINSKKIYKRKPKHKNK